MSLLEGVELQFKTCIFGSLVQKTNATWAECEN